MIGDRLTRIAQRLVREETYAAIVAPAIADLQFEAGDGRRAQAIAYAGVWRAVAAALIEELCTDTIRAFSPTAVSQILTLATTIMAVILACELWVFEWNWGFKPLDDLELTGWLMPSLVLTAGPLMLFPVGAVIARERRRGSVRALVLVAAAASVLLLLSLDYGVREANQRFREVAYAREGHNETLARGMNERSTWELSRHDDRRSQIAVHSRLAFCASTIGWALVGLGLRRANKTKIVVSGIVAYGLLLIPLPVVRSGIRGWPQLPVWMPWAPTMFLVCLGLIVSRRQGVEPTNLEPTN